MSTTLEGRLLCASVTAYSVQHDSTIAKCPPYDQAVSFTQGPVGFASGNDKINACLVGTNADGVIVAFRGTLPPRNPDHRQTLLDWINDFHAELITADNLPGKVHEGFWRSLQSLWLQLVPEVKKQMIGGKPLYITGHSKGGGMANLAAMQLAVQDRINATVCTFAGPHPGNEAFAAAYNQAIASTRYEYADDMVPHVPPSLAFRHMFATLPLFRDDPRIAAHFQRLDLDYAAVGTLQFINWDGAIVGDAPMLRF